MAKMINNRKVGKMVKIRFPEKNIRIIMSQSSYSK